MDDPYLEPAQVARLLGVSADTVRRWERLGLLPAIRTARGSRLFRRADVEALRARRDQSRTSDTPDPQTPHIEEGMP